ncbi:MAG: cupredoxin family protein, partial [Glaciimonas sp.]|nr:cupredoxin family protein [Glaciimonas sp.]
MKTILFSTALILSALSLQANADGKDGHATSKKTPHAAALGAPGNAGKVTRTVTVDMDDSMRFTPENFSTKRGETIKFIVKNSGKLKHEMVLGSITELKKHAAMMLKFPEMEHDDPNQVAIEPGKTGEFIWQFSKAGTFDFACLEPGHFEAGMHGKIS